MLAAMAIAGCGGGGDSTGEGAQDAAATGTAGGANGAGSPRSKEEFTEIANGICKRDDASRPLEIGVYLKSHEDDTGSGASAIAEAFRAVVVAKIPARIEQIRALGAPEGDERQVEAFLASLRQIVEAPESTQGLQNALRRSARLARAYGLHPCAYV